MTYPNIFKTVQLVNFIKLTSICFTLLIFINTAAMALSIPPMTLPPLRGTPNHTIYTDTGNGTVTRTTYDDNGIREESTTYNSKEKVIALTYYWGNGDPRYREHIDPKTGKDLNVHDDFNKDGSFTRTRTDGNRIYIIGKFDKNGNPIKKGKTTKTHKYSDMKNYDSSKTNTRDIKPLVNQETPSYRTNTDVSYNSTTFNREYGLSNINTRYIESDYREQNPYHTNTTIKNNSDLNF